MTTNSPHTQQAPAAPDAPETLTVTSKRVSCDGGGGALGHPRVWLEMGENTFVECPYCDRVFRLGGEAEGGAGRGGAGHHG